MKVDIHSRNESYMIAQSDFEDLRLAKAMLENPGLAAKISAVVGTPVERGLELLPGGWAVVVSDLTRRTIEKVLSLAIVTMDPGYCGPSRDWSHKLAVATAGAAGGAFGLPALALELPVSTTVILRSIADVARSEGEDLTLFEGRLACVQVLALGGRAKSDDAAETGYFTTRTALARAVSDAAKFIAENGLTQKGAPAMVKLVAEIASRFSVKVTQKAAAQAIPVVGAMGGALINTLFINHFQEMSRGHFIVRRLERAYGAAAIKEAYRKL